MNSVFHDGFCLFSLFSNLLLPLLSAFIMLQPAAQARLYYAIFSHPFPYGILNHQDSLIATAAQGTDESFRARNRRRKKESAQ